ncbi:hypothetical protein [Methylosinus sp. RM1]|uniref:hypothetical protein n=1 Tax=Methylosinus sp. RM1 TaxID=2583817 RepID=UPI00140BD12B|nr:hypothetical protein [Methylosinus sp. RM1]
MMETDMKKLLTLLVSGMLIAASTSAVGAAPVATAACYDGQGQQIACAPHYEGRSQATAHDGIDPLWAGGALLLAGGGIAAGLALSSNNNNSSLPFIAIGGVSP